MKFSALMTRDVDTCIRTGPDVCVLRCAGYLMSESHYHGVVGIVVDIAFRDYQPVDNLSLPVFVDRNVGLPCFFINEIADNIRLAAYRLIGEDL